MPIVLTLLLSSFPLAMPCYLGAEYGGDQKENLDGDFLKTQLVEPPVDVPVEKTVEPVRCVV